ncbi:hypothetical protein [Hydrogenimonas urashimensis]|uniref:hypothetical protein n=1 Tax=Hydrogenimonas urashimensis TaxID=2740515 RepID=UPI001915BAD0|nr:hypothetical protein [Hydrogenimonas urashimensis]
MCTSSYVLAAFLIYLFVKYIALKDAFGHALIDLDEAYEKLGTDQFETGVTDIGGWKARLFRRSSKRRKEYLVNYLAEKSEARKRLGKPPIDPAMIKGLEIDVLRIFKS